MHFTVVGGCVSVCLVELTDISHINYTQPVTHIGADLLRPLTTGIFVTCAPVEVAYLAVYLPK